LPVEDKGATQQPERLSLHVIVSHTGGPKAKQKKRRKRSMKHNLRSPGPGPGKLLLWFAFLVMTVLAVNPSAAQDQHHHRWVNQSNRIDPATARISVSVSPVVASVATNGTLSVTASVQNDSSSKGVVWSYSNPTCTTSQNDDYIKVTTSSACGTLTHQSSSSVTYNAPASVPSPAAITITATSSADMTKSASARIVVTNGALNVWISPTGATVGTGHTRTLTAIVSGSSNTNVNWQVNGIAGGNSTVGTINTAGVYTAPHSIPSGGTITVTAVSQANSAVSSSITVGITTAAMLPLPVHGVTSVDYDFAGNLVDIAHTSWLVPVQTALDDFTDTPTVRVMFSVAEVSSGGVGTNGTEGYAAVDYVSALQTLKSVSRPPYILGQVLDSSYEGCFSLTDHDARWNQYISTLGSYVDAWEVGNEINGNWLDSADASQSCPWTPPKTTDATVVQKMIDAYNMVRANGGLAELTLYYPGQESVCGNGSPDPFEPITWVKANVPANMLNGMDYVWISYYHTDCPSGKDPTAATWGNFFTAVQNMFPSAQIGFGEWGYSSGPPSKSKKTSIINEGYSLDPTSMPYSSNWVSGVMYWEFIDDAVEESTFWSLINTDMQSEP
jgi:hypothetical protein